MNTKILHHAEGDKRRADPVKRWPRHAWASPFAIAEEHALDVARIESDAFAAVMRKLHGGHAESAIAKAGGCA